MEYRSIAEIISEGETVRAATREFTSGITVAESERLADGEKWTLRELFEHVSLVDSSLLKLIQMLAAKSGPSETTSNSVAGEFIERMNGVYTKKLEAPDRVRPTGNVPMSESLQSIEENFASLKAMAETLEGTDLMGLKYPHPYFGEMTAPEWMVLRNAHETRHVEQAKGILAKVRAQ
ncbi:MAG: DinB family protein [Pyrinomonadaceae bacterium]